MKRSLPHHLALFAALCLTTAACDDGSTVDDGIDAGDAELQQGDEDENPQFVSVYAPFDPDEADAQTRAVADAVVVIQSADGEPLTAAVQHEVERIQLRFAHALVVAKGAPHFVARAESAPKIELTYVGKAEIAPADEDEADEGEAAEDAAALDPGDDADRELELAAKYAGEGAWLTGYSPGTGSEFEVFIPDALSEIIGADGEARGVNRGTLVEGEPELSPRSIVGPDDTRVLKGAEDSRQTSSNLRRIVDMSGCTGTLIGPHHVITAAHCIYGSNGWKTQTLRVGRNGSDWYGNSVTISGSSNAPNNTHADGDGDIYWISSKYKSAKDADASDSPKAYDIGLIITPDDNLAAQTGWFGWVYSNSSHDDMYNRGYPSCSTANNNQPPGGPSAVFEDECLSNHMYGDANKCGTGGFSNKKDSYGFSLFGYHSCDTSGAHSGSALYRKHSNGDWVVRGVHKGAIRPGTNNSSNNTARQSFALITRSRSNLINTYRAAYP